MAIDIPKFVPELNATQNPSRYQRVVSAIRSQFRISRYQEVFGERIYPNGDSVPTKAVIKDGILVAEVRLSDPWSPIEFVEPRLVPAFAVGRCIDISLNQDNKTVYIDQDGQSDTVIKQYRVHTYWGNSAEAQAAVASDKLNQVYKVIEEICPQFLLPTTRFTYEMPFLQDNQRGYAVFERQQRAMYVSPWLCEEPRAAAEIKRQEDKLSHRYQKIIVARLLQTGVYHGEVSLAEMNFGLRYDALTRSLKADDIIDHVQIDLSAFRF